MLYLVEENVGCSVLQNEGLDVSVQVLWVAQFVKVIILEVEIDYLVGGDTLLYEPVTVNLHNGGFC